MADPLPIIPPKENLQTVIGSNTIGGYVEGEETVPIDSLSGGISTSKRAQDTVKDIAAQMSSPSGYIERLIVDQDGNVIEGAHRLEALRKIGVGEIPVTRIVDPTSSLDLVSMEKAIKGVGKIHPDHINQIMSQIGDMLRETGNNPNKVLTDYTFPKGYEKYFKAALTSLELDEPRSTDLVPLAAPPEEDPSQKKPKQTGKMWRGIGNLMRRRMFPIVQAAQQGWGALSEEQKGQVTEFLNTPMHELVGMEKSGIDYFRQMLGMGPEQPEEGILSLPDLRKYLDFYHGTSNVWGEEEDYPVGRPRLDFMGTGEGAQVYAPGFYAGEERAVGVEYADMLAQKYGTVPSLYKGKMLEDVASEKFIDFNLPVNEQSQTVLNAFKNLGYLYETKDENRLAGADVFEFIKTVKGEDEAVEALRKEGVLGLRYLDKYSRQNQNLYKGKSIVKPSGKALFMNEDWQQHAREVLKYLVDENIGMEDFISQQREHLGSQSWFSRIFSGAKQEEKLLDVLEGTNVAKSPLTKNMVIWDQPLLDELGRTIEKEWAKGGFVDKPLYERTL